MGFIKKASELEFPATVKMMIYGQAGMGKAQPLFCGVLTPSGYRKMGDIRVGDQVMGASGNIQTVEGVYPQGVRPTYKVTTNDGAITYCDEEHIWNVRFSSGNSRKAGFRNMTLREMINKGVICPQTPSGEIRNRKPMPRFEIPVVDAMQFPEKNYDVHPYILGVLIGDGSLTGSVAMFSNPDTDCEIAVKVADLLGDDYVLNRRNGVCPQYSIINSEGNGNKDGYIKKIKALNLNVHCYYKFIPAEYKLGSYEQRLWLLRGLMDTDGTIGERNRISYSTTSLKLAEDVVELVNSLGGIAKIHAYDKEGKSTEYVVSMKIPENPFYLKRKANKYTIPAHISRYIVDVTKVEDCECQCIKVSNEDELYVTDNFIVTHNTTLALSAPKPLLLDFDNGVKRVNTAHLEGVDIVPVQSWSDIQGLLMQQSAELAPYQSIVVDTAGKMIDFIIAHVCGNRQPQLRDWGKINQEFKWFTRTISGLNKNIVFVAHRDTRKDGDSIVFIPKLRESNYSDIVTDLDLLGYMEMKSDRGQQIRTITFDPTDRNDGKNTCYLPSVMSIPQILSNGQPTAENDFIQTQVIAPYAQMLKIKAEQKRQYDELIAKITADVDAVTNADTANEFVRHIGEYQHSGSSLAKLRSLFAAKVKELGLSYDSEKKEYADPS